MPEPGYRWVIVASGAVLGCVAIGAMFSLPVFLIPMAATTGWSRTGISLAMTIGFLAMAFGSIFWGTVTDRFGPRMVVLIGSALLPISLALASFSRTLFEFQLVFGLCVGIAAAAIFAPMMATVTGWFETQRSLAVSLVSAGIYSLEGLAGLGGRVGFGILGDKFGAKRILVIGLLIQAFGALGYYFTRSLGEFYAIAALFGFTYAGVMPLYSVIARENFPLRMMGTIIGGNAMAGSLGMATGPLLGGWIFDTTNSYGWLYIASFGMGIGAALIALTFRPFPQRAPDALASRAR